MSSRTFSKSWTHLWGSLKRCEVHHTNYSTVCLGPFRLFDHSLSVLPIRLIVHCSLRNVSLTELWRLLACNSLRECTVIQLVGWLFLSCRINSCSIFARFIGHEHSSCSQCVAQSRATIYNHEYITSVPEAGEQCSTHQSPSLPWLPWSASLNDKNDVHSSIYILAWWM